MNVIECQDLTKSFGKVTALDHLSVAIKENKITGLIGRNGAGKTTLLKILAGHWRHTSGAVEVFGNTPFNNLFVSANTILIDDQMNFPDTLTLNEIMAFAENFYEKWDMAFAQRIFQYFSLHPRAIYQNLSKGKQSTFNVIIGLASRCSLTMFDEPTTGMDAAVRKDFYRALLKDYLAYPRTIIISSHHLQEVEDLLEDILLIEDGQKYLHLPVDDLKEYAVGLTGEQTTLQEWAQAKEVIYEQRLNQTDTYIVLKNNDSLEECKRLGFEVSSVSPSDLCVYLTNRTKGGIDDVFTEGES